MSLHLGDKLADLALKTIFIGYPSHQKGYKLYYPVTSTTHVSRHVLFYESQFSFVQFSPSTPIVVPPDSFYDEHDIQFMRFTKYILNFLLPKFPLIPLFKLVHLLHHHPYL